MNHIFLRRFCSIAIILFVIFNTTSNLTYATTSYYYDSNGRLVQESALTGETNRYIYDQNGNLKSKTVGESFFEIHSAFSSEQGVNNWYYQTWDGTRYEDMAWDAAESRWKGRNDWEIIGKEWMHPDGNDAVLKW